MATKVNVRTVMVELRTVNLTKALLKQFRNLDSNGIREHGFYDPEARGYKPNCVVGWFASGIINDNECLLFTNNKGDYFVLQFGYVPAELKKLYAQIYIV